MMGLIIRRIRRSLPGERQLLSVSTMMHRVGCKCGMGEFLLCCVISLSGFLFVLLLSSIPPPLLIHCIFIYCPSFRSSSLFLTVPPPLLPLSFMVLMIEEGIQKYGVGSKCQVSVLLDRGNETFSLLLPL